MKDKNKALWMTQFSMILAVTAIVSFTPLGSIPIGPIVASLGMIPVAVAGIMLGVKAGALMGFFAGLFSFIVWTFMPPNPLIAFIFTPFYTLGPVSGNFASLLICFVPRTLVGVVAALLYNLLTKNPGKSAVKAYLVAGGASSLVNTFGVLGGIYIFFAAKYAEAIGLAPNLLFTVLGGVVLTNGIPEALLGAICCAAICGPVKKIIDKSSGQSSR
ncbi:MAG: ECF transporter S component [Oscillospiraceae bacterium]|nr:ECF transporter S component [Oscillospiraceae bacterium]